MSKIVGVRVPPSAPPQKISFEIANFFALAPLGRRRVEPAVEARILELKASGDGILKIGRKLDIGTSVVQRVFKQEPRPS
ncbi:MAG TPA: hypothetical protein VIJ35_16825 [Bradyrhizobium sp.]